MAGALFLRKQFAPTSIATRRTLAALTSLLHGLHHQPSISTQSTGARCLPFKFFQEVEAARGFHAPSGRLDFRASIASQAGFAVADYSDEEKARGSGGGDECLEISKLGIHEEVVSSLSKRGITKLFPIQRAVLEPAMQGRDMIGRAKTGTGKTLAFGIPIMDKIIRYNEKHGCGRNPLALALAPTRELARQVEKEFFESAPKLDTLCVYGGTPIGRQMSSLDRGVDVIVGTPGRVIDLMKRGALDLSEVQFVVLDEADQMLNVGFEEAVEVILEKLPRNRQSMMFSATMPSWILKLTQKYLRDPLTIDLVGDSDQKLAEGITLHSIVSDHRAKAAIVGPLIAEHAKGGKCIVFTQTKRDADNLAYAMGRENYKCEPLHGDIPQGQRERTLSRFRDGLINILVATDVAARGLDIPNVDLVIHYELPSTSEIFVHRSGRTGRAGKKGTAILIYTMEQARSVRLIERDVGCKFKELPKINVDGANPMLSIGAGGRYGAMGGGRFGNSGFGRAGGYGGSGLGRSGGYNESGFGRSGGYGGSSFGRSSNSGEPGPSRFGSYGNPTSSRSGGGYDGSSSRSSDNFGRSGSGRPGGQFGSFGRQDRSGGSGSFGSSGSGGGFGGSASSGFGNFGSGRSRGFGDTRPSQSSSFFGDAQSNDTKSF